jgi:hypothetical protein
MSASSKSSWIVLSDTLCFQARMVFLDSVFKP